MDDIQKQPDNYSTRQDKRVAEGAQRKENKNVTFTKDPLGLKSVLDTSLTEPINLSSLSVI